MRMPLFLLALMFLSLPACMRSRSIDAECLGLPSWWRTEERNAGDTGSPRDAFVSSTIYLTGRQVRWNGALVTADRLDELLLAASREEPKPLLVLDTSEAQECSFARSVREEMDKRYCRRGECVWSNSGE